jgi:hypothetical protein
VTVDAGFFPSSGTDSGIDSESPFGLFLGDWRGSIVYTATCSGPCAEPVAGAGGTETIYQPTRENNYQAGVGFYESSTGALSAFVGCGPTPATFTLSKDSSGDIASIASGYGCVVEQISGPGTGISIAWNNFTFTTADGLNGTLSEQRTQNEGSNVTIETYNGTLTKDLDASVDMGLVADAGGDADATVVGTLVGD